MRNLIALALWIAVGLGLTELAAIALERAQTVQQQAYDIRDVRAAETPLP